MQLPLIVGDGRASKVCRECGEDTPLAFLKADKTKTMGRAAICLRCHREKMRLRFVEKRDELLPGLRRWYWNNKEKKQAYDKKRRPIYYRKRRAEMLAKTNIRRGKMRAQTPAWANEFFISEIYRLSTLRSILTGMKWEVDHIVPVVSHLVCGLHCEANLQVIPEMANKKKSNVTWPDAP
jgi:hypothetical protein